LKDIDIIEQNVADMSIGLLKCLLMDKTTKKYIRWATDNYKYLGEAYYPEQEMTPELITGIHTKVIQPRVAKSESERNKRTRDKAEVFTPSWICNEQNNLIDSAWFGRNGVFNTSNGNRWSTNYEPIEFPNDKTWQQYIDDRKLEVSCGEAPYLVSRYDTVTGEMIPVKERIGLLDRKLRIVTENTHSEQEWYEWVIRAYQSIYGYEYQGDNVLLARENLLFTFSDYMLENFGKEPDLSQLKKVANIVAWNIWQMDGITCTTPYSETQMINRQMTIFEFMGEATEEEKTAQYSIIKDWRSNDNIEFRVLINGGK
jgi:hypothetical protein